MGLISVCLGSLHVATAKLSHEFQVFGGIQDFDAWEG